MDSNRQLLRAALDILWSGNRVAGGRASIAARANARLTSMMAFASERSPFYRARYSRIPDGPLSRRDLAGFPPVTKSDLMGAFDEWSTDRDITLDRVLRFVTDKSLAGQLFMDRYAVWSTSGTTGTPGIFLHDEAALSVYGAMLGLRGWVRWMLGERPRDFFNFGRGVATVVSTGGHFSAAGFETLAHSRFPGASSRSRVLSIGNPLPDLVRSLNEMQPGVLVTYPTAVELLSREQEEGRLRIHPSLVGLGGEWLAPAVRAQARRAFGCPVHDVYAASEFMGIAFSCRYGRLHLNSDWAILEPVDAEYRPVKPGEPSRTVLLTNLANRVQPLIRYDLGDSVTMLAGRCRCGSIFPGMRVEGRRNEILIFDGERGGRVPVLPMAITTVLKVTPGVIRFQILRTGPSELLVRLEPEPGCEAEEVWERSETRLRDYLAGQGLPHVAVVRSLVPPHADPRSGKFRQVWSEWQPEQMGRPAPSALT